MAEAHLSARSSLKERVRNHPFVSSVIAALIGLMVGVSAAGNSGEVERLNGLMSSLRMDLREEQAAAGQEVDALEAENASAVADNEQLQDQISNLELELAKMNAKRPLPKLEGINVASAERMADKYGWELKTKARYSFSKPGTVISQSPSAGTLML